MSVDNSAKRFGIIVKMPENDPMSASHLLGDDWSGERWFDTAEARDKVFAGMQKDPGYYRIGDKPSVQLSKVDNDK